MTSTELKHEAKLQEWQEKIMDCRSQGITVNQWCQEHRINKTTYYRWERELLGSAKKEPRGQLGTPTFAELPAPKEPSHSKPDAGVIASVHFETASVDIYTGADIDVVATLFKLLRYAK